MDAALSYADKCRDLSVIISAGNNIIAAHALLQYHQELSLGIEMNMRSPASMLIYRSKNDQLSGSAFDTLDHRLYPAGEAGRETIECLLYTDPSEEMGGRLWCGMGSSGALFVCDVDTWKFDLPINVATNRIYVLEEYEGEIWAGSRDGNLYVVDTETGRPISTLPNHGEAISGITVVKPTIWTSSFDGLLICWNPKTRDVIRQITIPKSGRVSSLISIGNWLWCSGKQKLIAIDISDPENHNIEKFAIDFRPEAPLFVDCLAKTPNDQIWCGWSGSNGCKLSLWCTKTRKCLLVRDLKEFRGCTCMTVSGDELWIGTKEGQLLIINWATNADEQILQEAHPAGVRSLCTMEGLVASGSTSSDGYIAVWKKAKQ